SSEESFTSVRLVAALPRSQLEKKLLNVLFLNRFVTYPLCFSIFFVVADPLVRGLGRYNLDRSPVHDSIRGVVVEYLQLQVNFYSSSRPKMTTASQIVANLHKKLGKKVERTI